MQDNFNIASSASAVQSNKVLRSTYALLGFSLIPTVIGALLGMSMSFGFAAQSPINVYSAYVCWNFWFIFSNIC